MKKISFLNKLKKQNKLKLVESSDEVSKSYIEKSGKSMNSAKATFKIESFEDSVALAYYSMYYCVLALLFKIGIKCENHTAAIILLKEIFNIDNKEILKSKEERIDKQYYVDFSVTKTDVEKMIKTAEKFNSEILDFLDKLGNEKVMEYRNKGTILIRDSAK